MNMGDDEGVKNDAKVSPGLGMWVHSGHIHLDSKTGRLDSVVRDHESNIGPVEFKMF